MRAASSPAKGADGALFRKKESMLIRLSENGFKLRDRHSAKVSSTCTGK